MNMKYKTLLSLDSIYRFLNQHERIIAIKKMLKQDGLELTQKMKDALVFIEDHNWNPPDTIYGQDRLLYFLEGKEKKIINEYQHPISNDIKKLK